MKSITPILVVFLLLAALQGQASVVVTNGLTHRHDLQNTTAETGYVVLKNVGKQAERVLVYFRDLKVSCSGSHSYVDAGSTNRSNANWIKVGFEEKTLQPGEETAVRYEISAPSDSLKGSYWSLMMVEIKKPIDTTQLDYGVRVSSNVRYAIQIITDFGTQTPTNVEFATISMVEDEGSNTINVTLQNQCDKVLLPLVKIKVYNESGELVLEKQADTKKLYPAQCKSYMVPIKELARGAYKGVLVADCGESDLFGMTLNLEVDD